MSYDVIGLGAPVVDQVLKISEDYLSTISGEKGGQAPLEINSLHSIVKKSSSMPLQVPGGSATNTIRALANLGRKCALVGKIGKDELGEYFFSSLLSLGIKPLLIETAHFSTAQSLCLITPDGERTMRTYLGASVEMKTEDLKKSDFKKLRLLHVEGYALYNRPVIYKTMQLAKEAGAKISLDLASFEIVREFKKDIWNLLEDFVDIIFANEKEIIELGYLEDQKSICRDLSNICEISVLLMGKKGCALAYRGNLSTYPSYSVDVLDTTGAGDLFAGGFLHGYLEGRSLEENVHYGTLLSSKVIQSLGTEISQNLWNKIKMDIPTFH